MIKSFHSSGKIIHNSNENKYSYKPNKKKTCTHLNKLLKQSIKLDVQNLKTKLQHFEDTLDQLFLDENKNVNLNLEKYKDLEPDDF